MLRVIYSWVVDQRHLVGLVRYPQIAARDAAFFHSLDRAVMFIEYFLQALKEISSSAFTYFIVIHIRFGDVFRLQQREVRAIVVQKDYVILVDRVDIVTRVLVERTGFERILTVYTFACIKAKHTQQLASKALRPQVPQRIHVEVITSS